VALTPSELGVLCLLLFGLFYWLGIFAKLRAVLALIGVIGIADGGFLGRLLATAGAALQRAVGAVTAWAFGASLAAGLFIILLVIFIHDLHPKKSAGKRTGWVAVLLGAILVVGVFQIPALAPVTAALWSLPSSIVTFLNSL
jgi:hypothetical protein